METPSSWSVETREKQKRDPSFVDALRYRACF